MARRCGIDPAADRRATSVVRPNESRAAERPAAQAGVVERQVAARAADAVERREVVFAAGAVERPASSAEPLAVEPAGRAGAYVLRRRVVLAGHREAVRGDREEGCSSFGRRVVDLGCCTPVDRPVRTTAVEPVLRRPVRWAERWLLRCSSATPPQSSSWFASSSWSSSPLRVRTSPHLGVTEWRHDRRPLQRSAIKQTLR